MWFAYFFGTDIFSRATEINNAENLAENQGKWSERKAWYSG